MGAYAYKQALKRLPQFIVDNQEEGFDILSCDYDSDLWYAICDYADALKKHVEIMSEAHSDCRCKTCKATVAFLANCEKKWTYNG